ncbi:hypothetical protein B0H16DRAFT_1720447 [Mycena metata]|uniref:Uncharacterized protein n=1 Tax=Mycena metata TaxID=1033252 RepID=A0AAD7JAL0_9AGAR|nr:hypothetical protein B0H16DRAFT_1720447 [Mycena metata]
MHIWTQASRIASYTTLASSAFITSVVFIVGNTSYGWHTQWPRRPWAYIVGNALPPPLRGLKCDFPHYFLCHFEYLDTPAASTPGPNRRHHPASPLQGLKCDFSHYLFCHLKYPDTPAASNLGPCRRQRPAFPAYNYRNPPVEKQTPPRGAVNGNVSLRGNLFLGVYHTHSVRCKAGVAAIPRQQRQLRGLVSPSQKINLLPGVQHTPSVICKAGITTILRWQTPPCGGIYAIPNACPPLQLIQLT